MYQKEIIYVGLYKEGSRIGNAGFLKVENREAESNLDLKLKNIPFNIRGRFPIRVHNGNDWKEINGISVQEGGGSWKETMPDNARKVQIQIMLPGGYLLEGRSKDAPEMPDGKNAAAKNTIDAQEVMAAERPVSVRENVSAERPVSVRENVSAERPVSVRENVSAERPVSVRENVSDERSGSGPEAGSLGESNGDREVVSAGKTNDVGENIRTEMRYESSGRRIPFAEYPAAYGLKEDKWEQILDSYEKLHPYDDERVYVKLEPKDFIILQSKYQHLVNNSFLLHGFYNYRYIILGKEDDFYLGVPGVFYEREKMVALMFGFEAFECPGGIAKAGEFGYYLRKVEL